MKKLKKKKTEQSNSHFIKTLKGVKKKELRTKNSIYCHT